MGPAAGHLLLTATVLTVTVGAVAVTGAVVVTGDPESNLEDER